MSVSGVCSWSLFSAVSVKSKICLASGAEAVLTAGVACSAAALCSWPAW